MSRVSGASEAAVEFLAAGLVVGLHVVVEPPAFELPGEPGSRFMVLVVMRAELPEPLVLGFQRFYLC